MNVDSSDFRGARREDARVDAQALDESRVEEARHAAREELAPLFVAEKAAELRARWDVVQRGFVDDPAAAVRNGDALVAEVIADLGRRFAQERERGPNETESAPAGTSPTESLRLAFRQHRSFFERLLSL